MDRTSKQKINKEIVVLKIIGQTNKPSRHILKLSIQIQYNLVSCVQLSVTPWTVACQASLSIIDTQRLLKLMSIESVMPSNHPILHLK